MQEMSAFYDNMLQMVLSNVDGAHTQFQINQSELISYREKKS